MIQGLMGIETISVFESFVTNIATVTKSSWKMNTFNMFQQINFLV